MDTLYYFTLSSEVHGYVCGLLTDDPSKYDDMGDLQEMDMDGHLGECVFHALGTLSTHRYHTDNVPLRSKAMVMDVHLGACFVCFGLPYVTVLQTLCPCAVQQSVGFKPGPPNKS